MERIKSETCSKAMNPTPCGKQGTHFETIIERLQGITARHSALTNRALSRSSSISKRMIEETKVDPKKLEDDSLIGVLHSIMDQLDYANARLERVVDDLEISIPEF